ncbi:ATP-binding cassette domain-containing protein [Sanguibacter sp. 25GB23B1]|uniref:ATP-binding cassette domain-containing protein n=1 Tax=unclassified Sanguibacter TaxID=2645534 RepID=UPI0032AED060
MTESHENPGPVKPGTRPVLSLQKISKRFGAVHALTDVDLDVHVGEVVAIVGDNGAGKSTVVKVMAGVHPQDGGTIVFEGRPVTIPSPGASQDLGIATVYQDLALCDNLDIVSNLFLGREALHGPFLADGYMEQEAIRLLRTLSARLPSVRTPVSQLSGGQRQAVAVARSLLGKPKVVILDEPTAALGVSQAAEVLNLIGRLRDSGHAVVLISHNMADIQAVSDRIVVLRLGRNNGTFHTADVSYEEIIAAITGATDLAPRRSS